MDGLIQSFLQRKPLEIEYDVSILGLVLLICQSAPTSLAAEREQQVPEDWRDMVGHPEQLSDDGIAAADDIEDPAAAQVVLLEQIHRNAATQTV